MLSLILFVGSCEQLSDITGRESGTRYQFSKGQWDLSRSIDLKLTWSMPRVSFGGICFGHT